MPTLTSDTDGRYVNALGQISRGSRSRYSDFSLGYLRTLHPFA
jgi:hypothetical protein